MREAIVVQQIRCERCINKLAANLAPLKGLHEARVEYGYSTVVVDYDIEIKDKVDKAIEDAGLDIVERKEIPQPVISIPPLEPAGV